MPCAAPALRYAVIMPSIRELARIVASLPESAPIDDTFARLEQTDRSAEATQPPRGTAAPRSLLLAVIGRLVVLLACLAGPALAVGRWPLFGVVAAICACAVWARVGPRPLPGLLPGLLASGVLVCNGAVVVFGLFRVLEPLLRGG